MKRDAFDCKVEEIIEITILRKFAFINAITI